MRALCKAWKYFHKMRVQTIGDPIAVVVRCGDDDIEATAEVLSSHEDLWQHADGHGRLRISFYLNNAEVFRHWKQRLLAIPHTMLSMLQHLRTLRIKIQHKHDDPTIIEYVKRMIEEPGVFEIKRTLGSNRPKVTRYYTYSRQVTDLPKCETRKDPKGNYIRDWDVFLAFPVNKLDSPTDEDQQIYSSFPLDHPQRRSEEGLSESSLWMHMPLGSSSFKVFSTNHSTWHRTDLSIVHYSV